MIYSEESIYEFALGNLVEVTFVDGTKQFGWLMKTNGIPKFAQGYYVLLPLDHLENTPVFKRSFIKSIKNAANGCVIPKTYPKALK